MAEQKAGVDVLDVLSKIEGVERRWGDHPHANALMQVRTAVAELIEAANLLNNMTVLRDSGEIKDDDLVCVSGSTVNAIRAALARCGGA